MHFYNTQFDQYDYLTLLDVDDNYYEGDFLSFDPEEGALILDVIGVPQVIERKKILRMYAGRERSIWFPDPQNTWEACSTIETTDTSKFKPGELLTFMDSNKRQIIAKISKTDPTSITADIISAFQNDEIFGPLDMMSDGFILRTNVSTSADAKSVTFNIVPATGGAAGGAHAAIHAYAQSLSGYARAHAE